MSTCVVLRPLAGKTKRRHSLGNALARRWLLRALSLPSGPRDHPRHCSYLSHSFRRCSRCMPCPVLSTAFEKGVSLPDRQFRQRDAASCELCPSLDHARYLDIQFLYVHVHVILGLRKIRTHVKHYGMCDSALSYIYI